MTGLSEKKTMRILDMTQGSPAKLILTFAIPLFIGNIFQQVYSMVDTMVAGYNLGDNAIAAIGATSSLYGLIIDFASGLNSGYAIVVTQCFGAHDEKKLKASIAGMIALDAAVMFVLTAFALIFLKPLMGFMNTPDDIFEQAYSYIAVICAGMTSTIAYNMFASIMRAFGNSRTSLYFLIISSVLNMGMDLLLVSVLHMGVAGAAFATVIAQTVSAVLSGIYVFRRYVAMLPGKEDFHISLNLITELFSNGIAMALMYCVVDLGSVIFQRANNDLGKTIISALTVQQISLETGIPLPYLDDEIKALEDKQIIIREGKHYKANVIVITSECADEIERAVTKYHEEIADKMMAFLSDKLNEYKNLDFVGRDFSDNTLRWQLATILFRMISGVDCSDTIDAPKTGWGESAYLWCVEKLNEKHIFSYCGVDDKHGNSLYFFDYWKDRKGKGDHHDFYGNERYINIFCDICHGEKMSLSEYDLEAVAEMIKRGYVIKENETYRATVPVYTVEQYLTVINNVKEFISAELVSIVREMDKTVATILSSHTPKHLQDQVAGIAAMDKFVNAVCIPATILIERQFLSTVWHPLEMPTTYVVLK